jgi:hypothetical protein
MSYLLICEAPTFLFFVWNNLHLIFLGKILESYSIFFKQTKKNAGNDNLCGPPLESCESRKRRRSIFKIAAILVMVVLAIAVIVAILFIFYVKKKSAPLERTSTLHDENKFVVSYPEQVEQKLPENNGHKRKGEQGKLSFVRDDAERFDLQDLLRASAEILGSATFGSSYKAMITNGQSLVVKRYRQMSNVGREEFHEHMRRLGRLNHPNLLPLVAYYYRKEEKLLISEFVENGSLASVLHGKFLLLCKLNYSIVTKFT